MENHDIKNVKLSADVVIIDGAVQLSIELTTSECELIKNFYPITNSIRSLLTFLGLNKLSQIKNILVRVQIENDKVKYIGDIFEDKWLDYNDLHAINK